MIPQIKLKTINGLKSFKYTIKSISLKLKHQQSAYPGHAEFDLPNQVSDNYFLTAVDSQSNLNKYNNSTKRLLINSKKPNPE